MNSPTRWLRTVLSVVTLALAEVIWPSPGGAFPVITNVVETGGDGGAVPTAKWTGVTFTHPNLGASYTVLTFDEERAAFTDRVHQWNGATAAGLPGYLVGGEYIMCGNGNRDNASYRLDISLATSAYVYFLVDNRLGDGSGANPPNFTANMTWLLANGWVAVTNGLNRSGNTALPDEVGVDEGADGVGPGVAINQYSSVYVKILPAGTFSVFQPDNAGQNMYGIVVKQASPPATPQNLAALNGDGKVTLSWDPSAGAASYVVRRSIISGGPYDVVAASVQTAYVDTGLVNGLTYYYVVSASNNVGESAFSAEATGTPKPAPADLAAVGGSGQVMLTWTPLAGAAGYTVLRGATQVGPFTPLASGVAGSTYTDTSVQNGSTYYYSVVGQLAGGGESGVSDPAEATTAPGSPNNLAASVLAVTVSRLTWTIGDPVVSAIVVEQSSDGVNYAEVATLPGTARLHYATDLSAGGTYSFRVRAVNATGSSAPSEPADTTQPSFGFNINFANPSFATNFPGYVNDYSAIFGAQAGGLEFGWDVDNLAQARERNSTLSADKRYDTFTHLQKPLPAGRTWEITVPNGFYYVHWASGDATAFDSIFQFDIEGVLSVARYPTASRLWFDFTNTVIVTDGRLTVNNGPFAQNNKIDYIDIYSATTTPPVITAQPQSASAEAFHPVTFSVAVGGGAPPYRYQWQYQGNPIPGATGAAYTLDQPIESDAGAYSVVVENGGGQVASTDATLAVLPDHTPPRVVSAVMLSDTQVAVCFSERLDDSMGAVRDNFNYTLEGVSAISVLVRPDGHSVVLTTDFPIPSGASLSVSPSVLDLAGNAVDASVAVPIVSSGLAGADLGAGLPGSHFRCEGDRLEVVGGGTDLGGSGDQCRFVYDTVQGDFDARVRVESLAALNGLARAALMLRESVATNSRALYLSVNAPQPGRDILEPLARATTGGGTAAWGTPLEPAGVPGWLRLTRVGAQLTGYRSPDGTNWSQVAQTSASLPVSLLVGVAVTSHDIASQATGLFSGLHVKRLTPLPPMTNPVFNPGAGTFSASLATLNGYNYDVEYNEAVALAGWKTLLSLNGDGTVRAFTDTAAISPTGLRVYRISLR